MRKKVTALIISLILVFTLGAAMFVETASAGYYVYVKASDGGVNLRSGPSTKNPKVMSGMIPNGEALYITSVSGNWGATTYNGYTGWIALSQTTTNYQEPQTSSVAGYYVYVQASDGGVNLRSGPSKANGKVMDRMIPNSTKLHITAVAGGWGYTTYNGYTGWVALNQTSKTAPKQNTTEETDYYVYVNGYDGGVNLRFGPSTSNKKVIEEMIPNGEKLHITARSGDWGYTVYNNNYGWIALSQTSSTPVAIENQSELKSGGKIAPKNVEEETDEEEKDSSTNNYLIMIMIVIALLIVIVSTALLVLLATNRKRRN